MAHRIKSTEIAKFRKLSPASGSLIYKELRNRVTKARILDRDYAFYILLSGFTLFCFGLSIYQYYIQQNIFILLVWGGLIAFFTVQLGGLIHDSGHRAIFKSTAFNDILGFIFSTLVMFGYTNWLSIHNAHHARPNMEDEDPDLGIPWAFTDDKIRQATGLKRLILKHQLWLYFPLGTFAIALTRFGNMKYYYQKRHNKLVLIEIATFILGFFSWYILPFLIFSPVKAALFLILTNNLTSLYLINVFAPNHKGMPQIGKNVQFSFLEQQIITARNIYGHWMTDYLYLGLNYQIEHHLFPSCPRNKLKLIRPYVLEICKKYRLPYAQTSIVGSNRMILTELKKISKAIC